MPHDRRVSRMFYVWHGGQCAFLIRLVRQSELRILFLAAMHNGFVTVCYIQATRHCTHRDTRRHNKLISYALSSCMHLVSMLSLSMYKKYEYTSQWAALSCL